jgi:DNA-binding CsgD family transcriptional regulator
VLEQFRSATTSDLAPTSAFAPLTDRELEILRKVSDGMTNAEIGYALGISAQTSRTTLPRSCASWPSTTAPRPS